MITEKMVKMITKAMVSMSAIAGLVILECKAIELGIDGVTFLYYGVISEYGSHKG